MTSVCHVCPSRPKSKFVPTYDDSVERIVLTQENFQIFMFHLAKLPRCRILRARIFFDDLPASAEPWEKTDCENSSFPWNAINFSARRCLESGGHSNQYISDAKSKDFLYKTNIIYGFCMVLLQKSRLWGPVAKIKMTFHARFSPTAPLMSGGHRKKYEPSRFDIWVIWRSGTWQIWNFSWVRTIFSTASSNVVRNESLNFRIVFFS